MRAQALRALSPGEIARRRMLRLEGRPFFTSDWERAVFIHYRVDPCALQPQVPFDLDLLDGEAYVSLVAFKFSNLRPRFFGRAFPRLGIPFSNHGFLNVRTYVRVRGEPGIFFLAEWLANPLSVWLGPRLYGLPYRAGRLDYRHAHESGRIHGTVAAGGKRLRYAAQLDAAAPMQPCRSGSLDEFLLERYSAFTRRGSRNRVFRVWHPPWPVVPLDVNVEETSLLMDSGNWPETAASAGAHYSPGVKNVWVSPPRRL